jgi:hypothetical protein
MKKIVLILSLLTFLSPSSRADLMTHANVFSSTAGGGHDPACVPSVASSSGTSYAYAAIPSSSCGGGFRFGTAEASAAYGLLYDSVAGFEAEAEMRSTAIAEFTDQLTITGGTGLADLQTIWLLSYNLDWFEVVDGSTTFQFGSQDFTLLKCCSTSMPHQSSFAELVVTAPLAFTFGTPFSISAVLTSISDPVEGGIRLDQSTAVMLGVDVFQGSTQVTDFEIKSASGSPYPPVPEPSGGVLLSTVLAILLVKFRAAHAHSK